MNIQDLKDYLAGGMAACELQIKELEDVLIMKARLMQVEDIARINHDINKVETVQLYIKELYRQFPELQQDNKP